MSTTFPLYNTLMAELPERDLSLLEKKDFMRKITNLDQDAYELIYVLIKCFSCEKETSSDTLSLPFGGKLTDGKIEFDLQKFPKKLRQLLYKFLCLHGKKVEEDENMQKIYTETSMVSECVDD